MDEIMGIVKQITSVLLENALLNKLKKEKEHRDKYKFEKDIINNIECKIKEEFEKEKIKDMFMREEYKLHKNVDLYSDDDKEGFVQDFFGKNPELKYLHTKEVVNVIRQYIDRINEIVNELLTPEGKIIVNTIKKKVINRPKNYCRI